MTLKVTTMRKELVWVVWALWLVQASAVDWPWLKKANEDPVQLPLLQPPEGVEEMKEVETRCCLPWFKKTAEPKEGEAVSCWPCFRKSAQPEEEEEEEEDSSADGPLDDNLYVEFCSQVEQVILEMLSGLNHPKAKPLYFYFTDIADFMDLIMEKAEEQAEYLYPNYNNRMVMKLAKKPMLRLYDSFTDELDNTMLGKLASRLCYKVPSLWSKVLKRYNDFEQKRRTKGILVVDIKDSCAALLWQVQDVCNKFLYRELPYFTAENKKPAIQEPKKKLIGSDKESAIQEPKKKLIGSNNDGTGAAAAPGDASG